MKKHLIFLILLLLISFVSMNSCTQTKEKESGKSIENNLEVSESDRVEDSLFIIKSHFWESDEEEETLLSMEETAIVKAYLKVSIFENNLAMLKEVRFEERNNEISELQPFFEKAKQALTDMDELLNTIDLTVQETRIQLSKVYNALAALHYQQSLYGWAEKKPLARKSMDQTITYINKSIAHSKKALSSDSEAILNEVKITIKKLITLDFAPYSPDYIEEFRRLEKPMREIESSK